MGLGKQRGQVGLLHLELRVLELSDMTQRKANGGGFKLMGEVKIQTFKAGTNELLRETSWMKNIVLASTDRGVYLFLDRLAGITTYTGIISHADIGTDDTAATSADTALGAGVTRAQVGTSNRTTNQASFRFFFPDALLPDDDYNELMMFTDGTATLGTGQPFNRIVFDAPLEKAAGEDNSILVRITGTVE